jgi:hypothetical protein
MMMVLFGIIIQSDRTCTLDVRKKLNRKFGAIAPDLPIAPL